MRDEDRTVDTYSLRWASCDPDGYGHPSNRWRHGLDEMTALTEADFEQAALDWLTHDLDIAPKVSIGRIMTLRLSASPCCGWE